MNRRSSTALTASASLFTFSSKAKQSQRPNLLVIITDQQRFDALSIAGTPILKTPNMDRIGREGAYFEICNSQCPVCGPARSSLMTGRTVENSGVHTNMDADVPDKMLIPCYVERLSDEGYRTEYYGKWHAPLGRAHLLIL